MEAAVVLNEHYEDGIKDENRPLIKKKLKIEVFL